MLNLPQRIKDKILPEPNSGCWLWEGYCSPYGYGWAYGTTTAKIGAQSQLAHRLVYELIRGPIDGDMVLDHLCHTRCCVNPEHLEQVTLPENTRRGLRRRYGSAHS